jgi:hypothetical protein
MPAAVALLMHCRRRCCHTAVTANAALPAIAYVFILSLWPFPLPLLTLLSVDC